MYTLSLESSLYLAAYWAVSFCLAVYKDQGLGYMSVVQELCNKTMADARAEVKATQDYIASGDVSWHATGYLLVLVVCVQCCWIYLHWVKLEITLSTVLGHFVPSFKLPTGSSMLPSIIFILFYLLFQCIITDARHDSSRSAMHSTVSAISMR